MSAQCPGRDATSQQWRYYKLFKSASPNTFNVLADCLTYRRMSGICDKIKNEPEKFSKIQGLIKLFITYHAMPLQFTYMQILYQDSQLQCPHR